MNKKDYKRKLTAVFSADVAGYSQLMGEDEVATIKTLEGYKEIMFSLIVQHEGHVIDSPGDNLLAEFASVVDAVQCAVAIQKELESWNADLPDHRKMKFRIGINLGDVIEGEGRIYGDGVNIAAHLEALADPGGICISKTAFDQIETKLPLAYEYLGERPIKKLSKPVGVYRIFMDPGVTVSVAKPRFPKFFPCQNRGFLAGAFLVILALIGMGVWIHYFRPPRIEPASKEKLTLPLPELTSIVVLPFTNISETAKQAFLPDAITNNLITSLSKVPRLFVIARDSAFTYKGKEKIISKVSEELGVQYVLDGTVQLLDDRIRISTWLIDAFKGHQLWREQYDQDLSNLFVVQEKIIQKILMVMQVGLTDKNTESVGLNAGDKPDLDCYLKRLEAMEYLQNENIEEASVARRIAEEAIATCPKHQKPYYLLARVYMMEYWFGTDKSSGDSIEKAIELAHKSILFDEGHAGPHALLGHLYCLKRDWDKAIAEGEKAMALNPNEEDVTYWYAATLTYVGRAEEAILLLEKEIRRNPFAPSRYFLTYGDALRVKGRFDQAVSTYKESIQREPNNFMARLTLAATYSMMGLEKAARSEVEEVLRLNPRLSLDSLEKISAFKDPMETEKLFSALRKAGTPDKPLPPRREKPSIVIMPFTSLNNDMSQEAFAGGLTEEITTALSKIHELNIVARKFSLVGRGEPANIQQESRRLCGQYQLEGSVRQSDDKLRITAQLIDAATGNHIWAERYDRERKAIFSIQDELTVRILSALLVHLTEGEQAHYYAKGATNLDAYLKFLIGRHLALSLKRDANIKAHKLATEIMDLAPNFYAGYTLLALIELQDVRLGISKSPIASLKRSAELSRKSIAIEDTPFPHTILASIDVLMRNYYEALEKAKNAVKMDPNCADACMTLGYVLMMMDKADEAVPTLEKAISLMPYPPNNYFHNLAWAYVVLGKYEEAITAAKKATRMEPNDIPARLVLVCAYSFLDQQPEARSEAEKVLQINPDWSVDESDKWLVLNNKDKVKAIHNAYREAGLK